MKLLYGLVIAAGLTYTGLYQLGKYLVEHPQYGSMNVSGYNYTDRPIFSFNVGDSGGHNLDANEHGGGSLVCCLNLEHGQKEVKVEWQLDFTKEQFDRLPQEQQENIPIEKREKTVPIPPNLDLMTDYVGVHFLKNGNVKLTFTVNKFPKPLPENEREE